MRKDFLVGLGLAATIAAGCSSSGAEATNVTSTAQPPAATAGQPAAPSSAPTAAPTLAPATGPSPWTLAMQVNGIGMVNTAGFHDASFGLTVGYAGAVYYTTDGGKAWLPAENQSMCRFGLDIVDEHIVWHCGNGGVGESLDGGKTWSQAGELMTPEPNQCRFLSFFDGNIGWAATPTEMHATIDGGATWTKVALPDDAVKHGISAVHRIAPTDGFVLDTTGTIWTTVNMGTTWKPVSLGLSSGEKIDAASVALAAMRFTTGQKGLVVAKVLAGEKASMVALRTTDGGATWKSEQLALDPGFVEGLYLSADASTLTTYSRTHGITVFRYKA